MSEDRAKLDKALVRGTVDVDSSTREPKGPYRYIGEKRNKDPAWTVYGPGFQCAVESEASAMAHVAKLNDAWQRGREFARADAPLPDDLAQRVAELEKWRTELDERSARAREQFSGDTAVDRKWGDGPEKGVNDGVQALRELPARVLRNEGADRRGATAMGGGREMPEQHAKGPYKFEVHNGADYEIDGQKVVGGDALTIHGPRISIGPFKDAPEAWKIREALNVAYAQGLEDGVASVGSQPSEKEPRRFDAVSVNGVPLGDPVDVSINI